MLQQLHFPYPIQPTSFQTPNFVLTSQILYFLINSTVDNQKCSSQISTQQERINFINTACKIFAQHFSIQLDSRKLYCSDTKAVEELFRLCKIILEEYYGKQEPVEQPNLVLQTQSLSDSCNELLTSSTQLLVQLRDSSIGSTTLQLQDALAFNPNQQQIQNAVEKRIEDLQIEIQRFQDDIQINNKEKINLQEMLTQKQADLSRLTDRLQNMKLSRPAWLGELQEIEHYARKHRSLSWLEWVVSQKESAKNRQDKEKEDQRNRLIKEKKEDQQKEIRNNAGIIGDEIDGTGIQVVDENMDDDLSIYEDEEESEYEYSYEDSKQSDSLPPQNNSQLKNSQQSVQQNNNQQQQQPQQQDKSEYYSGSYYYEEEGEEESNATNNNQQQPQQQQQQEQQQQQVQQQNNTQQQVQNNQQQQQNNEEDSGSYYYEEYEEETESK